MRLVFKFSICFLFFLVISGPGVLLAQSTNHQTVSSPSFNGSLNQSSSSGHIKLKWNYSGQPASEKADFQLTKSMNADFINSEVIYQGDDLATYLSGLVNGQYFFRLRMIEEETLRPISGWSKPLTLTVKHHSLSLAITLFSLGAIVFFVTVYVLIKGIRDTN